MEEFINRYRVGDIIEGQVNKHLDFGVHLKVNRYEDLKFLIRIVNFTTKEPVGRHNYPPIGTTIRTVIVDMDSENKEVNLSLKTSDLKKYKVPIEKITSYGSWS